MKTYENFKIPKKNPESTYTHLQNTTQMFHILSENIYVYHVLTFWFSKTKSELELYLQQTLCCVVVVIRQDHLLYNMTVVDVHTYIYKLFCMISINVFDVISGGTHRRRQRLIKGKYFTLELRFIVYEKILVCDIPIGKYH